MQDGYASYLKNDSIYPERSYISSLAGGIEVFARTYERDLDYICGGPVQGFKVKLHAPGEFPDTRVGFVPIAYNTASLIAVIPEWTSSTKNLRRFAPNRYLNHEQYIFFTVLKHDYYFRRKCFFEDERKLRFFVVYNIQNCHRECYSNVTFQYCGCVKFSMPRK